MALRFMAGLALILVILGVINTIEQWNVGLMPFQMNGQHKVTNVESGGARVGVMIGDVLTHIDTVDVNARLTFLARPRAGETRSYTFIREGAPVRIDVVHERVSRRGRVLSLLATLAGVVFLAFPLWAASRNRAALPLATFGLGFGAAILGAPELQSNGLALFVFNARWLAAIVGAAGLLHFLASFPTPAHIFPRPKRILLLYAPVAVVLAEYLAAALTDRSWANVIGFTWFVSLFVLFVGICIMLVKWFRKGKVDRARRVVAAVVTLVSLLPLYAVLGALVPALAASTFWPPWDYFALFAMTGIPIVLGFVAARPLNPQP
jgi:hypothetical protein